MSQNKYLLKALRTMEREHKHLVLSSLRFATSIVRSNALGNFAGNLPPTFGLITLMLLVSYQLKNPELSGMAFLSFLYLFLRMVQSLATASVAYGAMNSQYPAFLRVSQYVRSFSDEEFRVAVAPSDRLSPLGLRRNVEDFARSNAETNSSSSKIEKPAPEVLFKNVLFRYNSDAPDVLRDFHLEIPAGGTCAIMGASGSGKSTILALLLGMLRPNSGLISLGGKTPSEFFSDPDLRLGFVGAEPYIIEGTIRDNLLYGVRDQSISDDELHSSLMRAQLGELVAGNPSFLDYVISESGEGLSTGQKQRLMFARALLAKPNLLVLDEASANLDEKTESLLAAEIQKLSGKCTTIIITHRSGFVSWVEQKRHLTSSLDELRHV